MFDFKSLATNAILEIVFLMLVAAIIGFLIAWFYWRQKYRSLEGEFTAYREQAEEKQTQLAKDIQALQAQLEGCREELRVTKEKLLALQMIQIKYDTLENKHSTLNEEYAKLLENHNALLTKNAGLGAQVRDLEQENQDQLTQLKGLNSEVNQLKGDLKLVKLELTAMTAEYAKAEAALADCRSQDTGAFENSGIAVASVSGKKKKSAGKVEKSAGRKESSTSKKEISTGKKKKRSKSEVLKEVASKRDTINYGLIGTAEEHEKQDLKAIKGIGPFIEQKLHALGIYTYAQIARFDNDLIDKVTAALEAFPGRILRDNWIGQAEKLSQ